MVWSGVAKYLLHVVQEQAKVVEISNFAIFGPVIDKFANAPDPLDKGPARRGLLP